MNQLTLNIPQIDEEATKSKAEKLLNQYRLYLLQVPDDFYQKLHLLTALFRQVSRMRFIPQQKMQH